MSRYARGYIKQDLHDNLIYDNATTAAAATAAVNAKLDDCTQSIVTGSRALGTIYQNTSGKIMLVSVSVGHACSGAGHVALNKAYVENNSSPSTPVAQIYTYYTSANVTQGLSMSFTVPPSYYYKVSDEDSGGGASTLGLWTEWVIL